MSDKVVRDFSTVDRKARMKLESRGLPLRPATERVRDFDEAIIRLDEEWAKYEASRCIHCPDPAPCQKACPGGNDISFAMLLIEQGQFLEAAEVYRQTSSLPEVCGRICPQERLCEGACVRGKKGQPVPTGALEAFTTHYERRKQGVKIPVGDFTGKKVAIIGAGPAGLACAEQLVRKGHWVTIFDAWPAPGGLLTYGIPNFKLPKRVVFDIWDDLLQAGVTFVGHTYIGPKITVDKLFQGGYDAVFVGVGTTVDSTLDVSGINLPGIYKATDFLVRSNVEMDLLPHEMCQRPEIGDKVVVIGGGDTGADCLRTALRLDAKETTCIYRRSEAEMPGGYKDRKMAIEEGAEYHFLTQPIRFIADANGHLAQIECVRTELGEPDESGRRSFAIIEDSNFIMDADTAILAIGYKPDPIIGATTPGIETHRSGLLKADQHTGATPRKGVFTGGDVVTGPHLVVTAMVAGRKAAASIDRYLGW
ncbi:MAG TPA: dihydropyrimidine dehydrogenase [Chloroflexi bacterium]|nr:dihydropyrimidine dehydrogenase [Chloroflexota bacterium]